MDVKIQEVVRTLSEFYPEPGLRREVHYALAHRFLPYYVHQNPFAFFARYYRSEFAGDSNDPTKFIQARWSAIFEPLVGLTKRPNILKEGVGLRRVSDLSMSIQTLGGRPCALIRMPEPEESPAAFFVAVVLLAAVGDANSWPRHLKARVFTLEKMVDPRAQGAVVGEWIMPLRHLNYGVLKCLDENVFLQKVGALVEAPYTGAVASYTPARCPGYS